MPCIEQPFYALRPLLLRVVNVADILDLSREIRGWKKLSQSSENVKKLEALTFTLNGLRAGFSGVNNEMQQFNQNISKSNEFLGKIAKLQESMEAQTKAATLLTYAVFALAALQVLLTIAQIVAKL